VPGVAGVVLAVSGAAAGAVGLAAEASVGAVADVSVGSPLPLFLVTCKTKCYKSSTYNIIIIIGNLRYRYLLNFWH
jgi:hypothetical protein